MGVLSFATYQELVRWLEEGHAKFVKFMVTDICGTWNCMTYDAEYICRKGVLEGGFCFDGSSVKLFSDIHASDVFLEPDVSRCWLDPFQAAPEHATLHVNCCVKVCSGDGGRHPRCARSIAQRVAEHLRTTGIADEAVFGPEPEFFVFSAASFEVTTNCVRSEVDAEGGNWNSRRMGPNLCNRVQAKRNYMVLTPIDKDCLVRNDMLRLLREVGIQPVKHHNEAANAQHELGFLHDEFCRTADNLLACKFIVRNVAAQHGMTATFMPKPLVGDNGSGCHLHQSLWKDGQNLFWDAKSGGLSDTGRWYVGGVLKHAAAIMAFSNPSTNSYRRLTPGYEAPTKLYFAHADRSAAIRMPSEAMSASSCRIETRFPDGLANPYLCLSAMILAGLDGIKRRLEPTTEAEKNGIQTASVQAAPQSLREALDALEEDHEFLAPAFPEEFISTYLQLKREEIATIACVVHPKEYELYYHV